MSDNTMTWNEAIETLTGEYGNTEEDATRLLLSAGFAQGNNEIPIELLEAMEKGCEFVDNSINKAIAASTSKSEPSTKGGALTTKEVKDQAMTLVQQELQLAGIDNFPVEIIVSRIDDAVMDGVDLANLEDNAFKQGYINQKVNNRIAFFNELRQLDQQSREDNQQVSDAVTQKSLNYHITPVESQLKDYTQSLQQRRSDRRKADAKRVTLVEQQQTARRNYDAVAAATAWLDELEAEVID
ncbi:hypothetical protein [Moorena sp. SIO3I8]|uniref:hypothetical protein n=1 Tax=Moorena sp. SIO3I8 TaxID=2607833 RepID=UPI0013C26C42|nr:hypothetical protein [Moorena sp. SIO3I8]NEO08434.1 hypothetical protein [Moorena sp. SIO3I8]